jgi:hypothetical protein
MRGISAKKKKDFTNTEITKVTLEDFKLEERR